MKGKVPVEMRALSNNLNRNRAEPLAHRAATCGRYPAASDSEPPSLQERPMTCRGGGGFNAAVVVWTPSPPRLAAKLWLARAAWEFAPHDQFCVV